MSTWRFMVLINQLKPLSALVWLYYKYSYKDSYYLLISTMNLQVVVSGL